ncbi:hypothetical protein [Bacteroides fragilis]|uniref:hypothetical protein n=1 Tax=Bacteroides fragilis TaxID=817 RepID=UPI002030DD27|nr:hypothetical protein [Bacteroides fragilis]
MTYPVRCFSDSRSGSSQETIAAQGRHRTEDSAGVEDPEDPAGLPYVAKTEDSGNPELSEAGSANPSMGSKVSTVRSSKSQQSLDSCIRAREAVRIQGL